MCQLIVKPAGVFIEKEVLHKAWMHNSDGAGFAYRKEDKLVYYAKGFFKFKKFYKFYKQYEHLDCLIHFRFATHGKKDQDNCHPFVVGDNAVLGHNGILTKFESLLEKDKSDTRLFVENWLSPALKSSQLTPDEFFGDIRTKHLIETLGAGSKFAVLSTGGFYIFNEHAGEWKDKVWYSAGYPMDQVGYCYGGSDEWYGWQRTDHGWIREKHYTPSTPLITHQPAGESYIDLSESNDDWEKRMLAEMNGDNLWEDEEEEEESIAGKEQCTICNQYVVKPYHIGVDIVCNACWHDYKP